MIVNTGDLNSVDFQMDVRVVTYNILSNYYARYSKCNPKFLTHEYRWNLLRLFLEREIKKKSIICLQELSPIQKSELHGLFANNDYTMFTADYGNMCVAIAFNYSMYKLKLYFEQRISDLPGLKPYKFSQPNIMIMLKLTNGDAEFGVCTYHMPVCYTNPFVMDTHISSLINTAKFVATGVPYIIGADMNMTRNSRQYEHIIASGMRDVFDNKPPDYTSFCARKDNTTFRGILDYIFISVNVDVKSVDKVLCDYSYIPDDKQSSDHLPICANLIIKPMY